MASFGRDVRARVPPSRPDTRQPPRRGFGTCCTSKRLVHEPDRFGLHAVGEWATARHRGPVTAATAPIRRTPFGAPRGGRAGAGPVGYVEVSAGGRDGVDRSVATVTRSW